MLLIEPTFPLCLDVHVIIKGKFLYSALSSPQDRSKRFTLYFPDRPVHSDTISASLGSIQPNATINAWRLSIVRYSFIQLSELEQFRVKKTCQGFNTAAQDLNPCSRSRKSEVLPLSHGALQCTFCCNTRHGNPLTRLQMNEETWSNYWKQLPFLDRRFVVEFETSSFYLRIHKPGYRIMFTRS